MIIKHEFFSNCEHFSLPKNRILLIFIHEHQSRQARRQNEDDHNRQTETLEYVS
jgi:hypothetical protein